MIEVAEGNGEAIILGSTEGNAQATTKAEGRPPLPTVLNIANSVMKCVRT